MSQPTIAKFTTFAGALQEIVQDYGAALRLTKLNVLFEVNKYNTDASRFLDFDDKERFTEVQAAMVFDVDAAEVRDALVHFDLSLDNLAINGEACAQVDSDGFNGSLELPPSGLIQ